MSIARERAQVRLTRLYGRVVGAGSATHTEPKVQRRGRSVSGHDDAFICDVTHEETARRSAILPARGVGAIDEGPRICSQDVNEGCINRQRRIVLCFVQNIAASVPTGDAVQADGRNLP